MRQEYTGRATYFPNHMVGPWRLPVAVRCFVGHGTQPVEALLDTGSEWCVLPSALARSLGFNLTPDERTVPLDTRLGRLNGRLDRVWIQLHADEGEPLDVDATCYIAEGWDGPLVLGWRGFLERLRFALDPATESFYFGEL